MMILKRIKIDIPAVGGTNCYIVQDEETKETMVIDPGGDVDKIVEMLKYNPCKSKIYTSYSLPWRPYSRSK